MNDSSRDLFADYNVGENQLVCGYEQAKIQVYVASQEPVEWLESSPLCEPHSKRWAPRPRLNSALQIPESWLSTGSLCQHHNSSYSDSGNVDSMHSVSVEDMSSSDAEHFTELMRRSASASDLFENSVFIPVQIEDLPTEEQPAPMNEQSQVDIDVQQQRAKKHQLWLEAVFLGPGKPPEPGPLTQEITTSLIDQFCFTPRTCSARALRRSLGLTENMNESEIFTQFQLEGLQSQVAARSSATSSSDDSMHIERPNNESQKYTAFASAAAVSSVRWKDDSLFEQPSFLAEVDRLTDLMNTEGLLTPSASENIDSFAITKDSFVTSTPVCTNTHGSRRVGRGTVAPSNGCSNIMMFSLAKRVANCEQEAERGDAGTCGILRKVMPARRQIPTATESWDNSSFYNDPELWKQLDEIESKLK